MTAYPKDRDVYVDDAFRLISITVQRCMIINVLLSCALKTSPSLTIIPSGKRSFLEIGSARMSFSVFPLAGDRLSIGSCRLNAAIRCGVRRRTNSAHGTGSNEAITCV